MKGIFLSPSSLIQPLSSPTSSSLLLDFFSEGGALVVGKKLSWPISQ